MRTLAYTYEADYHCIPCAVERFGENTEDEETLDGEGNPPGPVFSTDEYPSPLTCGTCGETIDEG